ncbi:SRPBCC family protein [Bacillus infantis]|uniref:SRPBCC family protein n=1 Tax=Bacillus infantis TaxID=324767 RepID=A0A5D4QSF2_9BACI|nr:SRPBCC family protein [Bacillus infantis]TYS41907.1 SRPBCC family protein [Bacillus infantis]
MPTIRHSQFIKAPIEICFDLARSVEVHIQTTSRTQERAFGGVTSGLLEKGDMVTWEAVHFGIRQRLTAKVTVMEKPYRFVDIMVKGAFKSFVHIHEFLEEAEGTVMIDTFQYESPFGLLGIAADKLFLERYMREFIGARAVGLKELAEKEGRQ